MVGIIGVGRLGGAITRWFPGKILAFDREKEKVERLEKLRQESLFSSFEDIVKLCDIILVATDDKNIEKVAADIAEKIEKPKVVVHFSGALPSNVLKKSENLHTASLHPLGTFTKNSVDKNPFANIFWFGEGEATKLAWETVGKLGGTLFEIATEKKSLYHLGASFGSYILLAILDIAKNRFTQAGIEETLAKKCVAKIAKSAISNFGTLKICDAMTGPVIRGDEEIIQSHLKNLSGVEREIYKAVVKYIKLSCCTKSE